ncbi:hypothetical protein Nmel_016601, partial [Mimus melanotis]
AAPQAGGGGVASVKARPSRGVPEVTLQAVTFRGGGAGVRPGRAIWAFLRFPSFRAAPFHSPPPCPGAVAAARPVWHPPPGKGCRGPLSFFLLPRAGRSGLAAIVRAGDALGWWQCPARLSWAGSGLTERAWALCGLEMGLLGRRAWIPAPW